MIAKTNPSPAVLVTPPGAGSSTEADIREVKPPIPIPSVWAWLGPLLIGLAIVTVAWWVWRRLLRRGRRGAEIPMILVPPDFRARERLREALGLLGQPRSFCIAISHALRVYLEEQLQLRAPERTTEEFLDELQSSPRLTLHQKESLGDFLERCDLVKFAGHQPGEPVLRELYGAAMRLVDETAVPSSTADAGPGPEPAPAAPTT